MKSQKFLPGTQLSGKIIDNNNVREFTANGKPGIEFTLVVKDVWKDKDGNKHESEPYYADCVAFGEPRVNAVKNVMQQKQMAVLSVLPKLEKWTVQGTTTEKSKTKFMVSRIEGWYFESGEWHCSNTAVTSNDDLPF